MPFKLDKNLKTILICYHKNLYQLYPQQWIDEFRESILNQTYKDYTILEQNYGGGQERIFENSKFESKEMPSFIHTMNHLINKAIYYGADVLANSNVDDIFSPNWLEVQVPYIEAGADIVSPNFTLFREGVGEYHWHKFHNLNIKEELNKNHNILCHPAICYSRKFLEDNRYIPEQFPTEDLQLWQRTIDNYKFKIVEQNLLYHRVHPNSVCQSNNR